MLEVRDLHAFYGKSHVLHGVNLDVREGEIVSLLGRNGVGRSTTVKAIMGQVDAPRARCVSAARTSGTEAVRDRAPGPGLRARGPRHLSRSHRAARTSSWDARRAAALGSRGRCFRLFPQVEGARRTSRPASLSGGEQQMLTLCRTLMGNPKLVMIDEPTEGLAPKIVELVARFLEVVRGPRHPDPAGGAEARHRARHLGARLRAGTWAAWCSKARPTSCARSDNVRKEWLEV